MQITVNGDAQTVADGLTVDALVASMDLTGKRVAVEVNLDIVPRSTWAEHVIAEGDRVEVVAAIGGG